MTALTRQQREAVARTVQDPCAFASIYLQEQLWAKQIEIMAAIRQHRQVSVKACHSSSKSRTAASLALWWVTTYQEALCLCLAPGLRQVEKLLFSELSALRAKSRIRFPPSTQLELKIGAKRLVMGLPANVEDAAVRISGYHSANVLVICDEASGIPTKIFDAVQGLMSSGNARLLLLGNPLVSRGYFYDVFHGLRDGWRTFTISAFDTPNLQGLDVHTLRQLSDAELDANTVPYLVTRRWVHDRLKDWGESDPRFESRVMAEFPSQSRDALYSLAWLMAAQKTAEVGVDEKLRAGIDVAGAGTDETVVYVVSGGKVVDWRAFPDADPRGRVIAFLTPFKDRLADVNVDSTGLGYTFALHLRDQGFPVELINFAEKPRRLISSLVWGKDVPNYGAEAPESEPPEQFTSIKSQIYWNARTLFKNDQVRNLSDETTVAQLSSLCWGVDSKGKIEVESKDQLRLRGIRSPDRAEALILALTGVPPAVRAGWWGE